MPRLGRLAAVGLRGDAQGQWPARVFLRRCCGNALCLSATWNTWTWTPSCWSMGCRRARRPREACRGHPLRRARPCPHPGPALAAPPPLAPLPGTPPRGPLWEQPAATAQVRRRAGLAGGEGPRDAFGSLPNEMLRSVKGVPWPPKARGLSSERLYFSLGQSFLVLLKPKSKNSKHLS